MVFKFSGKAQFPLVLGESRKMCLSTKFPLQKIKLNYGILRSDRSIKISQLSQFPKTRNIKISEYFRIQTRRNIQIKNLVKFDPC